MSTNEKTIISIIGGGLLGVALTVVGAWVFKAEIAQEVADLLPAKTVDNKVLVLDGNRIFKEQLHRMMVMGDVEAIENESDKFIPNFNQILQRYSSQGYVILPKQSIIKVDDSRDITEVVAKGMGLWPFEKTQDLAPVNPLASLEPNS